MPPLEEYVRPMVEGNREIQKMLADSFSEWDGEVASNGVDGLYKGICPAFCAFPQLDLNLQKQIISEAPRAVSAALQLNRWPTWKEPFSGLEVSWTYDLEGPLYGRYDQEWGNGLSLYGLYKYCQFTGDWKLIKKNC